MTNLPYTEKKMRDTVIETMKRAGTPPEFIYAFEKTGRLVTSETYERLSVKERKEWDAAIEEYFANHPEK